MNHLKAALLFALALMAAPPLSAQQAESRWSKAAPMTGPRSELQSVTAGGKIYVIGGTSEG